MDVNMETQNDPRADLTPPATDLNLRNKRKGEELEGQITKRLKTEEYFKRATNISDIPPEILREHVFKYFEFVKWIRFLAPVCRLWRQQAIISQAPKQLSVDLTKLSPTLFRILKEFKVDTMIVKAGDLTNIMLALDHAQYLNTLVFQSRIKHTPQGRWKQFNNIKTFSVAHCSSLWLMRRFPKLERLHINLFRLKDHERLIRRITPSVKEIELKLDPDNPNQDLKAVEAIQTVTKIYVGNSNRGATSNTDKLIFADPVADFTSMSYHEYFYKTGDTKLSHAIKEGNISKIESLLLNNVTSMEYEKELKTREVPFQFPFMARKHVVVRLTINKTDVDKALMSNNYSVFWAVFASVLETDSDITDIILQIKNYLPVPPHIPKIFAEFISKQTDVSIVPEDILKFMLAATNKKGNSFLHFLPKTPSYVGPTEIFVPYVDFSVLNNNGENPATVVFNTGRYMMWLNWMKYGSKVQVDKYHTDNISKMLSSPYAQVYPQRIAEIFFNYDTNINEPFIFTVVKLGPLWLVKDHHYSLCPILDSLLTMHGTTQLFDKNGRSLLNEIIRNYPRVKNAYLDIFLTTKLQKWSFDYNLLDKEGKTPLTTAIELQNQKLIFDLLLYGGAKPDLSDGSGVLPFMQLMTQKTSSDEYFYSAVMNFTDAGVKLNKLDFDECGREMYPIGMAIKHGQPKHRIESLVTYGADLKLMDSYKNTVFHALMLNEDDDYVIEMMPYLAKHVPINAFNFYGVTPMSIALQTGRGEKVLLKLTENGAMMDTHDDLPHIKDACQLKGLQMPALITQDTVIEFCNNCQDWPVSSLQKLFSDEQVVARVTDRIGHINVDEVKSVLFSNLYRTTPKGTRLDECRSTILRVFLSSIHLTRILLTNLGFNINTQTTRGETLLFLLNFELDNVEEITQYLLDSGIDVNIENDNGETAFESFSDDLCVPRPNRFLLVLMKHMKKLPNITQRMLNRIEDIEHYIDFETNAKKYLQKLPVVNVTELRKRLLEKQKIA